ncbi:MAG: c-type cytochrome [Betaproteobacteria bacterium]|nr:c-type cytochrome [Betaproteobacteria bacterium]
MKTLISVIALALALTGCTENKEPAAKAPPSATVTPAAKPVAEKSVGGDAAAGNAIAERECKGCHGLDGRGVAPGIPHLAAQRARYLLLALTEYKEVRRTHAALRELARRLTETELRNVVAYYASQPPVSAAAGAKGVQQASLLEKGKSLAAGCAKCHGEDGNSRTPGTPSLAGQQPHYLVTAIQEYHRGDRRTAAMKSMLRDASRLELESLALYYASRAPAQRPAPAFGDPAAGEPLTAMCGGCHGPGGVSRDAATPSLAGQDPQYLVRSIKAYRTSRQHWGMQRYVAGLSDKDIENITAFYVVQKSQPADTVPSSARDLAAKCDRCHDTEDSAKMVVPILRGQDKDYLVMALRAYRDDKRESTTMHKMSIIYSNAIIDDIASYYASQQRDKR